MKSPAILRSEINRLRKALRDLVAMNMRLDPTDEDRKEMKAAVAALKRRPVPLA